MQTVFVQDGAVHEVLPASEVPLDERYPAEFLAMCHEAGDQVRTGWTWDGKAFAAPVPVVLAPRRIITGAEFLALFTPTEVQALWGADARLMAGALKVAAQDSANLDSPEMAQMMALATAKGALTADRAKQVAAGTPPA